MGTLRRDVTVGVCWGAAVLVAGLSVAHVQEQSRDALVSRFSDRATTSATFVSAYVGDIFARERVMADSLRGGDGPVSLAAAAREVGFTASLLLDEDGRVVDAAPADPELLGDDLAGKYPHLGSALAGERAVSGVILSAVDQVPIVAFALPLDGGRDGVLSSGFSFDDSPLVEFLSLSPITGSRGYVIDASGVSAVHAGDGATASVNGIDTEKLPDSTAVVVDGRVVVAAPISGTPWRLVLTAPEEAIVAPATTGDWAAWWGLVIAALVSLGGLVLLRFSSESRRRSRAAQAESEQRFRLTVENAPIGMTLIDLDGLFFRPNARLCRMLGYPAHELAKLTFTQITHPDDVDVDTDLLRSLATGETDHYEREKRYVRRDASEVWVRLSVSVVRDAGGEPLHFVGQVEDLTEVRTAQENLERRALYDSLTGLANRSLLIDRLSHALAEQRRDDGLVAVAFCDLDHFKRVNDSLGHHAGDQLLEEVAARLQEVVRGGDTVARLGGDEFVLLLPRKGSLQAATSVLERAKRAVERPIEIDGHTLTVSFSAGLAVGGSEHTAETLLREADTALYAAKEGGRSRSEVYTAAMRSRALRHLSVEQDLRRAVEVDEFELYYQPIVTLADRRTVGFEGLLRWHHPSRGLLLPGDFLDVAEDSQLMVRLGQIVVRHACRFLARHPDAPWRVYINVAPVQLGRGLTSVVERELAAAGVPATRLGLEITENGVLDAIGSGVTEMQALRDMGIELLMDDFGTGYSALSSVLATPITGIKLDRSFTSRLGQDEAADRITATVAGLVDSLGAQGVVEGVETEDQCARALRHGWKHGQGYLFARPAPELTLELPDPDSQPLSLV